jgi:TonB family protein
LGVIRKIKLRIIMKKLILLLLFVPLVSFGQNTLKGNVVAYFDKAPLPGASIYNNRTKKQSLSDFSGDFTIKALIGDTISVSYVGFEQKSFKTTKLKGNSVELFVDESLENKVKELRDMLKSNGSNMLKNAIAELKDEKTNDLELEIPFASIEEVPIFPGCERVAKSDRRKCFQEKIMKHINKNFRYPEFAQKTGIQGRVFVQFMIGKDGDISGIRTRGPHSILEREANRIISLLPKMKPGTQKGRLVRVPFSIPITFRLQ